MFQKGGRTLPVQIEHFEPSRTALIVVDMENDFVADGAPMETPAGREMIPRLRQAIEHARAVGIRVIYTTHTHRGDGCDLGRHRDLWAPIATGVACVDDTPGIEIYSEIAPAEDEIVIRKRRYSAFFGSDLDIVLRGWGVDTVVITGVTTENCCHATARDAFFRDYRVAFLSDATATFDYADLGQGAMPAAEVHRATLIILAASTAHVMSTEEFCARSQASVEALAPVG
jgi:ureidoacrylate peracid hydrolase